MVVPGEPEKSKLIKAIRREGDLKMPPKAPLPAQALETLTAWVKLGVPFPASRARKEPAFDPRTHWAFQSVRRVQPPTVKDTTAGPIDRFVLAKLEAKGLSFAPPADRRTLIRRAYYDLIGLPPTPAQIEAFIKESATAPQAAYEALIDRLLASPQYGEAQTRHWLDLARYADTKGYVFQEDRNYPYAFTYRDWVIRACNDDMPYDRFVQLQIAADRMSPADKRDLAAMGFLTLGRRFLNNIHDIIDDRLDVTARTFLALTIACARCHDHKFDPIPARDYYSLYGVFASSFEPKELPLIGEVERTPQVIAFEKELQKRDDEMQTLVKKLHATRTDDLHQAKSITAYLLAVRDLQGKPNEKAQAYLRERELNSFMLERWRDGVMRRINENTPIFGLLRSLAAIADADFANKAPPALATLLKSNDPKNPLDPRVAKALEGAKPTSFKEVAELYGKLLASPEGTALLGAISPIDVPLADAEKILNRDDRNKITALRKKIDAFKAASPSAPPRAMVLNDAPAPTNPYVFLRGNPGNRGPAVPRQFLEILSGPQRKPFTDGSGRLELARAITDPANPLTARVMVNRLWIIHFGAGLVRTPSNFGARSDAPTHPELLDCLAADFVDSGWSVKKMHRQIMLSRAYQQSSVVSAELARVDPENRLLARMNCRRLDFEPMRDSLLLVAGQLDATPNGKPVDIFTEPFSHRRTIYGFIDRQNLPGTFRVFDFASPDQHSPQRFTTTVPQQALFLMNSPFVMEQARKLAARPDVAALEKPTERIAALIRLIHGRAATPDETALALAFLEQAEEKPMPTAPLASLSRWGQLAQVLLLSNEFAFVD